MKYKRKNLVSEQIDDELVIFDHETSRIIKLNHTASLIWKILKKRVTTKQLVSEAKKTYPDAEDKDIRWCLASLKKEKTIDSI